MTDVFELSHAIEDGLETYPGLPTPRITDHLPRAQADEQYAPGTSFAITSIDIVANTGTYIDAPFHRYEHGADLAGLPLAAIANVPGICVRVHSRRIEVEAFQGYDVGGQSGARRDGMVSQLEMSPPSPRGRATRASITQ